MAIAVMGPFEEVLRRGGLHNLVLNWKSDRFNLEQSEHLDNYHMLIATWVMRVMLSVVLIAWSQSKVYKNVISSFLRADN